MINWSYEELQRHINEICSGEKLITIERSQGLPFYCLFKYPNRALVRLSDVHVDKTIRRAKTDKFMTEAEMMQLMREKRIWTDQDDLKVESIQKLIDLRRRKLSDPEIGESQKPYIAEAIVGLEKDLYAVTSKKDRMLANTAEYVARQEKYDFLTWAACYDLETDKHVWSSYINYLTYCREVDTEIKGNLLSEFLQFLVGHSTEEIRYIARNNIWRIDYLVAQAGGLHLFPASPLDLTPDQKNLIWWTKYYQSIYEMMPDDQPEDYIIEDDESLDKYMEELHKERSQERASRRAERKYGSTTAMKMAEKLIMRSHPDYLHYSYDTVNPNAKEGRADISLNDDPQMKGKHYKTAKAIQKSKKYSPK